MGLDVEEGIAGTGVAANIKGELPGNTIALRADMDALNIEEETSKPYASRHKGLSHSYDNLFQNDNLFNASCLI